ncbi:hypothetical protein MJO47_09290 [Desulfuromonas sp. KJ2020]|uniref:hypothetical protein n=1 Tax=Desulfuromonas sp. KJ2020 TaxID=2919173 RepID=UPI0020A73DD7|nr:hypothetical protein [Desulfuromonas sp. KJ2020]MCP3177291.1 hypothetical protein [Desulfuromonas sp. KJ2020]
MAEPRAQQVFKNRKAAHLYLLSESIQVGQTKFYDDCGRYNLVQPDKSILLADLLAYVRAEHKQGPAGPGRDLGAEDRQRKIDELDLREKELKVEKLEREKRNEDRKWVERDKVYQREGALVATLMNELRYQIKKVSPLVVSACHGEPERSIEVANLMERSVFDAFQAIYERGEISADFEEENDE